MLTKLLKKDFQSTARLFLPLILGFAALTVLCKIMVEVLLINDENPVLIMFATLLLTVYVIYLIAYYLLTQVFIVMDFYKTMVGEQGYLTHTLPVTFRTLLHSKLLIATFWQVVTFILTLLSIATFFMGHIGYIFDSFRESITIDSYSFAEFCTELQMIMGISFTEYAGIILIACVLGLFSAPLMFYVSIAFGHLFGKHRILGSVLSYLGIYAALQIITVVMMIPMQMAAITTDSYGTIFRSTMWGSILVSLITTALCYVITNYIFSKKLNLE